MIASKLTRPAEGLFQFCENVRGGVEAEGAGLVGVPEHWELARGFLDSQSEREFEKGGVCGSKREEILLEHVGIDGERLEDKLRVKMGAGATQVAHTRAYAKNWLDTELW